MTSQSKRVNRLIQEHSHLNQRSSDSRGEVDQATERMTEIRQELVELHRPEEKG